MPVPRTVFLATADPRCTALENRVKAAAEALAYTTDGTMYVDPCFRKSSGVVVMAHTAPPSRKLSYVDMAAADRLLGVSGTGGARGFGGWVRFPCSPARFARQPATSGHRNGVKTLVSGVCNTPSPPHTPFGAGLETFSIYDGVEREIDRLFRNGCLTSDGASHLAGFGAMLVLDCVINNFDRAPLIWRNQGVTCDVRVTCVL